MIQQFVKDVLARPDLFMWDGSIPESEIRAWQDQMRIVLPQELIEIWQRFGGGDFFETERLLSPIAEESLGDNIGYRNRLLHHRGMSKDYLAFHVGLYVSAIRLRDQAYVRLDPETYHELEEYGDFDDWYNRALKKEYSTRYGLT